MFAKPFLNAALSVALVTAAASGVAQEPDSGPIVTIEGTVVDVQGAPLAGVTVRPVVWEERDVTAESNEKGRFRLELKASGALFLNLIATTAGGDLQGFYNSPTRDPSDATEPIEIVMKPPRTIDVSVRDDAGRPVEGAQIEVAAVYRPLAESVTDAEGLWRTRIPVDAPLGYVIALKDGVGFDYYQNLRQFEDDPNAELPDEFELTLDGALEVDVVMQTDEGEPVPGVVVLPWTIQKPGRASDVNVSGSRIARRTTGEDGIVTFGWLPQEFERAITFLNRAEGWHAPDWPSLYADAVERRVTYRLRPMVSISGRVSGADSEPAVGITVQISGEGANFRDNHSASVVTDEDGRYEALVPPQLSYLITVSDDEWASETLRNVLVYSDRPRDDLDLTLIPGTRVHGMVRNQDGEPAPGQYVTLTVRGEQVPFEPDDGNSSYHAPSLYRRAVTDEDGRYELRVGPGTYGARGPDYRSREELVVTDQPEIELDFEFEEQTRQPLTGRVVRADDGTPVPGVVVNGVQIDPNTHRDITTEANAEGEFRAERYPSRMLLHAKTPDGALGGTREITHDVTEITLTVSPTTHATGRIVDETGRPTAGFSFRYAIEVKYPNGTMSSRFGGTAVTDDDGHFTLKKLIVGQEYECRHQQENTYYLVTHVTAEDETPVELGTIEYPRSQRDRTFVEWVRDAFPEPGDPAAGVSPAQSVARLDGRSVLLVEGAPDDALVRSLFQAFSDKTRVWRTDHDPLRRYLSHYVVAGVAAGSQPLRLVVLDADGAIVAEAGAERITTDAGELDVSAVTQFLEAHAPPAVDAEERLAAAFETSAETGKPVFVLQVEAHAAESERMLRFVVDHAELLESHYVLLPVDAGRMTHGGDLVRALRQSLIERYVDPRQRQVPWVGIIDATGTLLASSEVDERTVGYPSDPAEIEHFLSMLQQTAPGLSDSDLRMLRESLEGD